MVPAGSIAISSEQHLIRASVWRDWALCDGWRTIVPGCTVLEQAMSVEGCTFVCEIVGDFEQNPVAPREIRRAQSEVGVRLTSWLPQVDQDTVR